MVRLFKFFLFAIFLIILNGCSSYKKVTNLTPGEVRLYKDIRITSIYTIYGDTLQLDYSSILIATISDTELTLYGKEGFMHAISRESISGIDIKYRNRAGSITATVSIYFLTIIASAGILILGLYIITSAL